MESLYNLTNDYVAICDELEATGGELTEDLAAALDSTLEGIAAKGEAIVAICGTFRARAEAAAAEIKRLQAIKRIAENGERNLREYLAGCMQRADIKRIDGRVHRITLSRRRGYAVDEDAALAPYYAAIGEFAATLPDYVKVTASISKTAIKEAHYPNGVLPAGVTLEEKAALTIV